ncbi:hypothetical protein FKP32DRAFT_986148 [Trametes sanguinea]|nr:hypothetical protein FKP32DRAFT_986148 [Trametes sanguinea]
MCVAICCSPLWSVTVHRPCRLARLQLVPIATVVKREYELGTRIDAVLQVLEVQVGCKLEQGIRILSECIFSLPLAQRALPIVAFETIKDTSPLSAVVRATGGLLGHQYNLATVLLSDGRKTHIRADYHAVPPPGSSSMLTLLIDDDQRQAHEGRPAPLARRDGPHGTRPFLHAPRTRLALRRRRAAEPRPPVRPLWAELLLDDRLALLQRREALRIAVARAGCRAYSARPPRALPVWRVRGPRDRRCVWDA